MQPTMRGPYESGDLPGMNLTFSPLGSQKVPGVPTKGRLMDSIGFDVADLQAYVAKVAANGVTFDVPYGRDAELGLMSATVTDPWGATIRLTEGLSGGYRSDALLLYRWFCRRRPSGALRRSPIVKHSVFARLARA